MVWVWKFEESWKDTFPWVVHNANQDVMYCSISYVEGFRLCKSAVLCILAVDQRESIASILLFITTCQSSSDSNSECDLHIKRLKNNTVNKYTIT